MSARGIELKALSHCVDIIGYLFNFYAILMTMAIAIHEPRPLPKEQ
jgi:hypothetical protein